MEIPIEKCTDDKIARRQLITIQTMEEKNKTQQLVSNQSLCWRETTEAKIHRVLNTPQSELQNKNQGW